MYGLEVKTYNDALCLSRCIALLDYVPKIPGGIGKVYEFLKKDPRNRIGVSDRMLYYVNAAGEKTEAQAVQVISGFDHLVMGATFFKVTNTATNSDSSGCGGCSSNNNNNNNNNNG